MCIVPGLQQSSSGSTGFDCCTSSSAGPHTEREQQQETSKKGCMDEVYSPIHVEINEKAKTDFHHVNFWRVGKGALFLFLFFFLPFVDI
jgi:hypothetical protein